jgi:hypothetical protein
MNDIFKGQKNTGARLKKFLLVKSGSICLLKKNNEPGVVVVHVCNTSYSGGRDWEDNSLRPVKGKSSPDPQLN